MVHERRSQRPWVLNTIPLCTTVTSRRLDAGLQRRAEAQEDVSYWADKYRRARTETTKARCLDEWHWEQRMFDLINDSVHKRYKANLENRSFAEGASKEGATLEEFRKDRALRDEFLG